MAVVLDALFLMVLLGALIAYGRSRDPVHSDAALIFVAMSGLFVFDLLTRLGLALPAPISDLSVAAVLAAPVLTVRLLGRLRRLPRRLLPAMLGSYLLVVVLVSAEPDPLPRWVVLVVTAAMAGGSAVAAALLAAEARGRPASPQARLLLGAAATGTFALAIAVSAAGSLLPAAQVDLSTAGRAIGLLAALGYAVAFAPPAWLRRVWTATAVERAGRRLLTAPPSDGPGQIWQRYVDDALEVCAVAGVVLLLYTDQDEVVEAACAGMPARRDTVCPAAELDRLLSRPQPIPVAETAAHQPALAVRYAERIGARFVRAVPIQLPPARGALLLLNRYRDLLTTDDVQLLADLAAPATPAGPAGPAGIEAEDGRPPAEHGAYDRLHSTGR